MSIFTKGNPKGITPKPSRGRDLQAHMVVDTEFTTEVAAPFLQASRKRLSAQAKSWGEDKGETFLDSEIANAANEARIKVGLNPCPILETECVFFDLLNQRGIPWELRKLSKTEDELPVFTLTFYAHFSLAELNLIFDGVLKEVIINAQKARKINMKRRLTAGENQWDESLSTGFAVNLEGKWYEFKVRFIDTCAIHGMASYKDFCTTVDVELKYKDNFTSEQKSRMFDMMIEKPLEFEEYALGDLEIDKALTAYCERVKQIYTDLGLVDYIKFKGKKEHIEVGYYQEPKLTIGATVKALFEAILAKRCGVKSHRLTNEGKLDGSYNWVKEFEDKVVKILSKNSPRELEKHSKQTRALLSKVQGGRCRNNKSLLTHINSVLCDIDISGCYGEGQRNQLYPIGNPEILDLQVSDNNHYPCLFNWLKQYGVKFDKNYKIIDWGELVPSLWHCRVSTLEPLIYPQDLLESWTTPSEKHGVDLLAKFSMEVGNDTDNEGKQWIDFDSEYGNLKIYRNEVHNAVLTHDLLQIIIFQTKKRQRVELLKKLRVTCSMVYPKSTQIKCDSLAEGLETYEREKKNWKYKNTFFRDVKSKFVSLKREYREYHGWIAVNMGELIVDNLLINRKKAQHKFGRKSSEQTLYKLFVNTLYGDMVSRFFKISNPVVGNNITARARAVAYTMEKGLNGWQSITDGCAFELNRVMGKAPTLEQGCDIEKWIAKGKLSATLLGGENSTLERDTEWIDDKAWDHLRNLYKDLDIYKTTTTKIVVGKEKPHPVEYLERKGQFSFETKSVYSSGSFHGSANYVLKRNESEHYKMRGYEGKKQHTAIELNDRELTITNSYKDKSPSTLFLDSLANPHAIPRQSVAIKTQILKLSEWQNHQEKYERMGLLPGDSIQRAMLMSEFSLSQFTFATHDQYVGWSKSIERLKLKNGQSLEAWFLNEDGTLDYQRMMEWVQAAIERGVMNPIKELDPHNNRQRDIELKHPAWDCLQAVKVKQGEKAITPQQKVKRRKVKFGESANLKSGEISNEPKRRKIPSNYDWRKGVNPTNTETPANEPKRCKLPSNYDWGSKNTPIDSEQSSSEPKRRKLPKGYDWRKKPSTAAVAVAEPEVKRRKIPRNHSWC